MISHTLTEVDFTINALKAKNYLIRLSQKSKPSIEYRLEPNELREKLESILEMNQEGYQVFFRPNGLQYVLLNRLNKNDFKQLRGFNPCIVAETHSMHYQAWLRLKDIPQSLNEAQSIYKALSLHFPGCISSYMDDNFGRLPGFFNRNEALKNQAGFYPLVQLHQHKDRDCCKLLTNRITNY